MDMFNPSYEEVDLIKDFTKKKDTKRTVHITSGVGNPTIVLKKGNKIKETFNLMMVTSVETSQSTNLIQLMSDTGKSLMIRTKSKASKKKFMKYLTAGLPQPQQQDSGSYEEPSAPRRAETVRTHNREAPSTTPRKPGGYQSGVPVQVTQLPSPVTAYEALSALPENGYDISGGPTPFGSLVSTDVIEESPVYNGWQDLPDHVYDEAPTAEARSSIHHQYAVPDPFAAAGPEEMRGINGCKIPLDRSTPSPGYPGNDVPDAQEYTELRKDAYASNQNPPPYMGCNIGGVVHPPDDTDSEDEVYEDVLDHHLSGKEKQSFYERLLKCEMAQKEMVTRGFERQGLLEMKTKYIEPHGLCIVEVPACLKHSFYEGDKIVNINSQTITDGDFARQIIQTSANEIVSVTAKRLFMGDFIEFKLQDSGEPLGCELDGTKIKNISPGTHFGRQAHRLLETAMCITHINTEFVPIGTSKKQVEEMLRAAGLSFFLILQPIDFAKELCDN